MKCFIRASPFFVLLCFICSFPFVVSNNFLIFAFEMTDNTSKYYLPAEWHRQVAVQLTWPHADTDWAPYLDDIVKMELEMAKQITLHENLIVATPHKEEVEAMLRSELSEEQMNRVDVYSVGSNDTWARDHASITLLSADGEATHQLLFHFNGWGDKFVSDKDNQISGHLLKMDAFRQFYGNGVIAENHDDFVLEGGAIESDGKGTVFTTSFCLMAPNRNQPLTREEVETQLLERLHAERVVWIDHGQLIGDDTDGHIDTIVRPAPDDTLLYVKCYDENDEQYADFQAMEEQLKTFRTMEGKPYRLLPLPMAKPMYDDGETVANEPFEGADRIPATYANFLIINDAVLVPTYGQPELDRQALEVIQQAFPDREVVGIDAQVAVRQHGSLHCLTMQFPEEETSFGLVSH